MYKRVNEILGTKYKSDGEIDWIYISAYQTLSENFIREFKEEINWSRISYCQKLSESFIREFKNRVDWEEISSCQVLSEDFIREFKDYVYWGGISANQILSENFIREFEDKVDWTFISSCQKVSIDFIKENNRRIDNEWLSEFRIFSWEDLINNSELFDWNYVSSHQPFIEDPNYKKIDKELLKGNNLYRLYQQTKNKGWFVGYIKSDVSIKFIKENGYRFFTINLKNFGCNSLLYKKIRIYWKDLIFIDRVKLDNIQIIRQLRYV